MRAQVVGTSLIPKRMFPTARESLRMAVCLPPGGDWMSAMDDPLTRRLVAKAKMMSFFIIY